MLNLALATVVGLNGTLVEARQNIETFEYAHFSFNVPFRPKTVQMPNETGNGLQCGTLDG